MSSLNLEVEARHAEAAALVPTDSPRKWRPNRLGMLWTVSALLHVVAVIALLRSWDTTPPPSVNRPAAVAQIAANDIQVVRLELAVTTVRDGEVLNAVHVEPSKAEVPHVGVPCERDESIEKENGDDSQFDSLELRPAANASITPDPRFRRTKWELTI